MGEHEFLRLADELGYRPIRYAGRLLLASVDPAHGERFNDCATTAFLPVPSEPTRQRLEVAWPGSPAESPTDDGVLVG
jgi:hypothetical protein